MSPHHTTEIFEGFSSKGTEPAVDGFMADCREMMLTGDPALIDAPEFEKVQAAVSLAVQRILHWAWRHRNDSEDPEDIPSHAIIGVMTGVGLASLGLNYDAEDIAYRGTDIIRRANAAAKAFQQQQPDRGEPDA